MAQSKASTVAEYLQELPAERRTVIDAIRQVIRQNLPEGYRETVAHGMITYCVPLETFSDTYNKEPLGYVALAAQKNYNALYLMCAYIDPAQEQALKDGFRQAGKKLDMGKSCLRFRAVEDLPLDVIGQVVSSTPPARYVELYEKARARK